MKQEVIIDYEEFLSLPEGTLFRFVSENDGWNVKMSSTVIYPNQQYIILQYQIT